jgi:acetoin utilization protein AcuB
MAESSPSWNVGSWMTDTPMAVAPGVSVQTAFFKMRVEGYRHLLVVQQGDLVGIVTDRDLRRPDSSSDPDGWQDLYSLDEELTVAEVMTKKVETVTPETPLIEVVELFLEHKFGALPVVDDRGRLVGIVSQHDVLAATRKLLATIV